LIERSALPPNKFAKLFQFFGACFDKVETGVQFIENVKMSLKCLSVHFHLRNQGAVSIIDQLLNFAGT